MSNKYLPIKIFEREKTMTTEVPKAVGIIANRDLFFTGMSYRLMHKFWHRIGRRCVHSLERHYP